MRHFVLIPAFLPLPAGWNSSSCHPLVWKAPCIEKEWAEWMDPGWIASTSAQLSNHSAVERL
jgi:hypothetical protein